MRRIYQVKYQVKYRGVGELMSDHVSVLANGDATVAIEKARKHAKRDAGVQSFKLVSVEVLAEAEI